MLRAALQKEVSPGLLPGQPEVKPWRLKRCSRITCGSDPQLLESLGTFCWCQWMADKQCRSVILGVSLACALAASTKRILQGCKVHFGSK